MHIIGPELGLSLPGTTIVCGDSHTSTHGALGALAFGIGTSEVEHVMATQTLLQQPAKNMKVRVDGTLGFGCSAKDIVLAIIGKIGTAGGTGHVIEYTGEAIRALDMAGRMTVSNMTIEAGARAGLIAPDETTFDYIKGREFAPKGEAFEQAVAYWRTLPSDPGAHYDTTVMLNAARHRADGDLGHQSGRGGAGHRRGAGSRRTWPDEGKRAQMQRMLDYMALKPGQKLADVPMDVVFIGSCTNGRIEDIRAAAAVAKGRKVAAGVQALVVPGSGLVKQQAEDEGLDRILLEAGFEWRDPCCSMCLGMNPDKLTPRPALRQHVEPQLRGAPGPGRTHASGVAGDGRRRRGDRAAGGCAAVGVISAPLAAAPSRASGRAGASAEGQSMDKFTTLTAVAAPMPMQNIDTDKVIPARFLKTIKRSGLGVHLFDTLRFDSDGKERPEFVLNQEPYRNAQIIIAHENFGCGSSREHAPWALLDFGIRCVIAPDLRRHLLQQQLQERHPADPPAARDLRCADRRREARRQRAHHRRSRAPGGGAAERRGDPLRHRPVPQALCC